MDLRKVYGGTPVGQDSKCDTCVYARIIRGYSESEKITICDRIFEPIHIPFRVRDCSDYLDRRLPCVEDLEDIAWVLRSKSAGKNAGFIGITQAGDTADRHSGVATEPEELPLSEPEAPEEIPAARRKT